MRYGGDNDKNSYGGDDDHEGGDVRGIFTDDSSFQGSAPVRLDQAGAELVRLVTRDRMPRAITICLASPGIAAAPGTAQGEIFAQLDIGIGGTVFQAEVDFVQGVTFTLVASAVTVRALYRRFPGSLNLSTVPVTVGAAAGLGVVASGRAPQRTLGTEIDVAAGGGLSALWVIPAFAKAVRLVGSPAAANAVVSLTGGVGWQFPVVAFPSPEIPIPSDAYNAQVQNNAAAGVLRHPRLIFDLAL